MSIQNLSTAYSKHQYVDLLKLTIQRGYKTVPFTYDGQEGEQLLFLRHDVDYSLTMAVELARINHDLGVRGTFCLLLRSDIYNLLSEWALTQVGYLQELGQDIGLHFSLPKALSADLRLLPQKVLEDFAIMRGNISGLQPVFSWHNPPSDFIKEVQSLDVAGLINTYEPRFTKDVPYYSDSNMRYSVEEFRRLLNAEHTPRLQLLLHPCQWIGEGESVLENIGQTWKYVIRDREREMLWNRHYRAVMPDGMSDEVVDSFRRAWLNEARRTSE